MEIVLYVVLILVGLVLIVKGGDFFVDAASWMAKASGIPTFIIGATIVSLGTTLPEILTSVIASAQGSVDLAIGNAIGSVNGNIGLIMGISLVFLPALIKRIDYWPKTLLLIGAVVAIWLFSLSGSLGIWGAVAIICIFALFIVENLISAKRQARLDRELGKVEEKYVIKGKKEIWKNIILFIVGAAGIAGGAVLLSTFGEKLAIACGVPSAIIGVTIIALGTSLPELVTTIIAISKHQSELSVGNIIGANVIDMTLILPLCSFISGGSLPVNTQTLYIDLPYCLFVSVLALVPTLITKKFNRWQGIVMLTSYAAYMAILFLNMNNVIPLP